MDTFRDLACTEINFIRQQAGWLYAFASGLADHCPNAAAKLSQQATMLADEAEAAVRRAEKIDAQPTQPDAER